jgi:uncharacterized membrane protein YgdD (TMEM256/DUF423 family)
MRNKNLSITALLGLSAIILGAFGAHALKAKIGGDALATFETGVRYQMFHVILLLIINMYTGFNNQIKNSISMFLFLGILFFCGSLYAISAAEIDPKNIWFITPIGGLFFIIGWGRLFIAFLKMKKE